MIIPNEIITKYLLMDDTEPNIIRGAMNENLEEIKAALANNPNCINETDDKMRLTAMHIAAANGAYDIIDLLCEQPGYDIGLKDAVGRTPDDLAWIIGRHDIIDRMMRDTNEAIMRSIELDEAEDAAKKVTALHPKLPTVP